MKKTPLAISGVFFFIGACPSSTVIRLHEPVPHRVYDPVAHALGRHAQALLREGQVTGSNLGLGRRGQFPPVIR